MYELNINEFGNAFFIESYLIKDGKLDWFDYLNNNIKLNDIDGPVSLSMMQNKNDVLHCNFMAILKDKKLFEKKLQLNRLKDIYSIIDLSNITNSSVLSTRIINYSNSTKKDNDDFYADLNSKISIGPIYKDNKVYLNNNINYATIKNKDNEVTQNLLFLNNGYTAFNYYEKESTIENIEITSNNEVIVTELSNIEYNQGESYGIDNLDVIINKINYNNEYEVEIDYDENNMIIGSSDEKLFPVLYNKIEDNITLSIHPFFIDLFDYGIKFKPDQYCIDQLFIDKDYNAIIYNRIGYKINDLEKFKKVIKENDQIIIKEVSPENISFKK